MLSSFKRLGLRLQFVPLGLLWGVVLAYYMFFVHSPDRPAAVDWETMGPISGVCVIATLVGSAILRRELTAIRWMVNWVITGVASVVGGLAIFFLVGLLAVFPAKPGTTSSFFVVALLILLYLILSAAFGIAIVTLATSTTLTRKLTPIRWVANCLGRGVAFCLGCLTIPLLLISLWGFWRGGSTSWSDVGENIAFAMAFWLMFFPYAWVPLAIWSAMVALVLAPLSLLGRWLILRRRSVVEPAGGASQSHP